MPNAIRYQSVVMLLCGAMAFTPGCASYKPRPLSHQAVDHALEPPTAEQVQSEVADSSAHWPAPLRQAIKSPLSPDKAAVLAVVINPSLRAERDRRGLARAQVLQAGILPNPQLSFGLTAPTGANTSGEVIGTDAGLSWDVTDLIWRGAEVDAAKADARRINLDVAWSEWQIAEAAKSAAIDLVALKAELSLRRDVDERRAGALKLIRSAVDRHEGTLSELAVAQAAAQQARADVLAAEADVRSARLALHRAIGLPPDVELRLGPDPILPSNAVTPAREELLSRLESRRLDLLALRQGYESQENRLRAEVLRQFPKINIGFTQTRDTGDFLTVGFAIAIDLPIFDRNQGRIAIEKATRAQLFDEYIQRVFEARADVAQALEAIRSQTRQIAASEAALPALEQVSQNYQAALKSGDVDALTAFEAQNNVTQARIDLLESKRRLGTGLVALELAAGVYLPLQTVAGEQPPTAPERLAAEPSVREDSR